MRLIRLLYSLTNTPEARGSFGEMIVASIFHDRYFGKEEHYLVNNLIFETTDGSTHQIDHVAIYKTGIFCIETKNLNGLVVAHPILKTWKVYTSASQQYDIFNPIIQNKGHINVLSEFLGNKYNIHSAIVFVKCNKPDDCGDEVLNLNELEGYIKNYPCSKELTSEEMKRIYNLLTCHKDVTNISTIEHINNVKNRK